MVVPVSATGISVVLSPSARWLLLAIVSEFLQDPQATSSCGLTDGARLLKASFERCVQRCRDSMDGCDRVARNGSLCAIGIGPGDCGAGWSSHAINATTCRYGVGKVAGNGVSICTKCLAGYASHAQVGDLAGSWSLKDGSAAAGSLTVTLDGRATYSNGLTGRFVLYHSRADLRYPGAFFLAHTPTVAAGHGPGWDYAWLEDIGVGGPRLTVRKFCGKGPVDCPPQNSPEGSPSFERTLTGQKQIGAALTEACPTLDANAVVTGNTIKGECCLAAEAVKGKVPIESTASFSVAGQTWKDVKLREAAWNKKTTLAAMKGLQGAKLVSSTADPELCKAPGSAIFDKAVVLVMRGSCEFAKKALSAQQAGAIAVIIGNVPGKPMPGEMIRDQVPQDPVIPSWMVNSTVGPPMNKSLSAADGTVVYLGRPAAAPASALTNLCCEASCRARVDTATAAGRLKVQTPATCGLVDCASYVAPTTAPPSGAVPPIVLPHAKDECFPCGSGLAAVVPGLASCAPCGDGSMAMEGGRKCEGCPAGKAGTGGQCLSCAAGREPDASRQSCLLTTVPPPPPPPPVIPNPPPSPPPNPSPGPGNWAPPAPAPRPYTGVEAAPEGGGIPWGTIIGIILAIVGICGCAWFGNRIYQQHGDRIKEGGGVAGMLGSVLGATGGDSSSKKDDNDDEEEGGGGKSGDEKGGSGSKDKGKSDAAPAKEEKKEKTEKTEKKESSGGGGGGGGEKKGKSMTIGGIRVNIN